MKTYSFGVPALALLLALFVCSTMLPTIYADPCVFLEGVSRRWVGNVSDVRACFDSIPLSSATKRDTLTVVKESLAYHSFSDFVQAPPGDYPTKINWPTDLSNIENTNFNSEHKFHAALFKMYNRFGDAHLQYWMPEGFGAFTASSPLALLPKLVQGTVKYFVTAGSIPQFVYSHVCGCNVQLADYFGSEVVEIDGVPVADYITTQAPLHGDYIDTSVLANEFTSSVFGGFRYLYASPLPDSNTITFTFAGNTTATRFSFVATSAYLVKNTQEVIDRNTGALKRDGSGRDAIENLEQEMLSQLTQLQSDFKRNGKVMTVAHSQAVQRLISRIQASSASEIGKRDSDDKEPTRAHMRRIRMQRITQAHQLLLDISADFDRAASQLKTMKRIEQNIALMPSATSSSKRETLVTETPLVTGDTQLLSMRRFADSIQYLTYDKTTVLRLNTFSPDTEETAYRLMIMEAHNYRESNGANENLIIDVTRNGGGLICLNLATLSYLVTPWASRSFKGRDIIYSPYDLRISGLSNSLQNSYELDTDWARDPSDGSRMGSAYYTSQETRTYGPATSRYTKKYLWDLCGPSNWLPEARYTFKKIIVLTDGRCGSACSYFINQLRQNDKVRIVTYGGMDGQPMAASSFEGGNVYTWDDVLEMRPRYPSLPTTAYISFNFRQSFGIDSAIPRQYVRRQGDWHLRYWEPTTLGLSSSTLTSYEETTLSNLYASVLPLFDQMPADLPRKSTSNAVSSLSVPSHLTPIMVLILAALFCGLFL